MHAWCAFSGDQADRDPICMAGLYNKEMGYLFGCMLGQAPKCLTARWTPKDVYFRNAMRVKPSPRIMALSKQIHPTNLLFPKWTHDFTRTRFSASRCVRRNVYKTHIPDSLFDSFASKRRRRRWLQSTEHWQAICPFRN